MLRRCVSRAANALASQQQQQSPSIVHLADRSFTTKSAPTLIHHEVNHNVALIRFNQPETYNAMTRDMGDQLESILEEYTSSPSVSAVVFSGMGRAFSSGGDLDFLLERSKDTPSNNAAEMVKFYKRFLSVRKVAVPTIAAINGPAVGAGACFAMACDLRVMAQDAKIGFTFSKLGIHPGMAATHYLPKAVGPQVARRLLFTSEIIDAETALRMGLVTDVVDTDVVEHALNIGRSIPNNLATRLVLKTLRAEEDTNLDVKLQREADAQAISYSDPGFHASITKLHTQKKGRKN